MIRALIRSTPEDFQVDELPAYSPSGQGEHLYVTFQKRGLDTLQAVGMLARKLGVAPRDAGTAGLKDRHAVTTQTASFSYPIAKAVPEPASLEAEGLKVLSLARHGNKLKTGHLRGNRFTLVLRGVDPAEREPLRQALERLGAQGLPNRFGVQRFGRHGDNAAQARAWLSGSERAPHNPKVRRLQFSALQAELFHKVLDRRVADGTWARALEGELLVRPGGGRALRLAEVEGADELVARGEFVPSGPLYGAKMPWPDGEARQLEEAVLAEAIGDLKLLETSKNLGEGARRPLRLVPTEMRVSLLADATCLQVEFVLPKGAYATTVLDEVCSVEDASRRVDAVSAAPTPEDEDPKSGEEEG